MPKQKKPSGKSIYYVKAASLLDLARLAAGFGQQAEVFMCRQGSRCRLFVIAENLGDIAFAPYVDVDAKDIEGKNLLMYSYSSDAHQENATFIARAPEQNSSHYANIIDLDISTFKSAKKIDRKSLAFVRINRMEDLAKSVISRSMQGDRMESAYCFTYKGKKVMGAFELFDQLSYGTKIFYYCFVEHGEVAPFVRYNYLTNRVDFSKEVGDHSYIYAKVVALDEPMPSFKF